MEDKFFYQISEACVMCGKCQKACPADAITKTNTGMRIDPEKCIDCGTCSAVCPVGAPTAGTIQRKSIKTKSIDESKLYFNPGCALSEYKPYLPPIMYDFLKEHYPEVKMHNICCRHDPQLPEGATIIANCAGCDRRFRSLYNGIKTISFWELADQMEDVNWPDHSGLKVSIHDSCGYRHKPQVHEAIRSLLRKMNIEIVESEYSGTSSICCGDNFYGAVPNEQVEERIQMRADQMPCNDVVVYCIGCVRAMQSGGKQPHHLLDLLFDQTDSDMLDTLDEYHGRLVDYINCH